MEECKEVVEDGMWTDTHDWVEVIATSKIQTLKCKKCGKFNTAKFSEDYKK